MFFYHTIISPLDQFEIRNLFSIDTPLLANINLSITNIGLYMIIASFLLSNLWCKCNLIFICYFIMYNDKKSNREVR
jgi:hypothetical protein